MLWRRSWNLLNRDTDLDMPPSEPEREKLFPRWSAYGLINGTTNTAVPPPQNAVQGPSQTPSLIPSPSYAPITVTPADKLPATTTHAAIPQYPGSGAILNGYCETPAYTILDGPTALWVPVVGCISSKSDCCATSTLGSGAAPTGDADKPQGPGPAGNGGAGTFPISSFPAQGTITGCPDDYHTVGGTACCPSSYWLWSTDFGGQVPCYSSLQGLMTPPPVPDTLVEDTLGPKTMRTGSSTSAKPTSAIRNIVYAMQYPMVPPPKKPALKKEAKIGLGVGVSGAAILIGVLLVFIIRKFMAHKKTRTNLTETSVSQRFNDNIDTSYVAHHAAPAVPRPNEMSRSHGGAKYAAVSSRPADPHY